MTTATMGASDPPLASESVHRPRPLAGLWPQLRFLARRDRIRAPMWIAGAVGVVAVSTISVLSLYPTHDDLATYAKLAQADRAFTAIAGPGYGLDDPTEGAVVMNEVSLYTYVAVALMATFMMVRHTRAEEESGRAELVRAVAVGRSALLAAAGIWVSAVSLAIGVGLAIALLRNGLPLSGSVAFAASAIGSGVVFAGIAAVAAQLATTSRAANSFAGITLGVAFLLRAVGDIGAPALRWLSPLGIAQAIRPFAGERWWVPLLLAVIAASAFVAAVALSERRDFGAGFIAQRPGRPIGSARLATPLALAARIQRGSVVGWAVSVAVLGAAYGLVLDEADSFLENDALADLFAQYGAASLTDAYVAMIVLVLALLTSGFTVASVLRLRSEEVAGRVAPMLATPVSRVAWWTSHTVVAVAGTLAMLVVGALGMAAGGVVSTGEFGDVGPTVAAMLTMFAPLTVVAAITSLMVAAVPRWSAASWAVVALATIVGLLDETLRIPQWLANLSPFEHVPALPAERFELLPIVALLAVAGAIFAVAAVAITRRDIS